MAVYFSLFGRQMEIDLVHLDSDGVRVREAFAAAEFGSAHKRDRLHPQRVEMTAWVRPEGGVVRVSGEIEATATAECDRCLKPFELAVVGSFDQRYVCEAEATGVDVDETELDSTELDLEELAGGVLDLRDLAREQVALNAPMHVLCSDACAGLCPDCGGDRNVVACSCGADRVDPRWEALKQFRKY